VLQLQVPPTPAAPAAPAELDAESDVDEEYVVDMLGRHAGLTFIVLSECVRLASSLVTYNLKCNPWHENKVLVSLLFLIGRFHFSHLR
jgi:hypothetical protein